MDRVVYAGGAGAHSDAEDAAGAEDASARGLVDDAGRVEIAVRAINVVE